MSDLVELVAGLTRDVRGIGHLGTRDREVAIHSMGDLEKAKPLFDLAYQNG